MWLTALLAQDPVIVPSRDPVAAPDLRAQDPATVVFVLGAEKGDLHVAQIPADAGPVRELCVAPCTLQLEPGPTQLWLYEPDRWQLSFDTELRPGRSTLVTVRPRRALLENAGGCTWSLGASAIFIGTSVAMRSLRRGDNQTALAGAVLATNGLGVAALGVTLWALGTPRAVETPAGGDYTASGTTGLNE